MEAYVPTDSRVHKLMATMNATFPAASNHPLKAQDEQRISRSVLRLRVPIVISGKDKARKSFTESTATELVSPCGATIDCSRTLEPEQEILINFANKEILGRVVGQTGLTERGHSYGIAFLQEDQRFWGVSFPKGVSTGHGLFLECCRCGKSLSSSINEIEALVLRANRLILMPCSACKDAGPWKIAEKPVILDEEIQIERYGAAQTPWSGDRQSTEQEPDLVPVASMHESDLFRPAPRGERRRHKRLNLSKAKACIEKPGNEPDIVDVVNVSRGGACVRTASVYSMGSWIRVACPYTIGGSNIFQSARIVRITVGESSREYGIEYVRLV